MKILTPTFKKIARITFWSSVAILILFLVFTFGGSIVLAQIEHECLTNHVFAIGENIFECEIITKGILS